MSQLSALRQWTEEIRKNMPNLSKPQAKVLAAFSVGIAKAEGCGLSAAAKKLPFVGNPATVERGIRRFIASDRIDRAESCRAMAKRALESLPEDKPVVLLVDETSLKDGLNRKAIVVANRGIGSSPRLIRETAGLGMFCLTRVTKKARAMMEGGEIAPFDELSDAPGMSWRHRARVFKKSGMASGAREQALAGDGAVVRVDGGLGRRGVWLGQGGERSGGLQVAGGALRPIQAGA